LPKHAEGHASKGKLARVEGEEKKRKGRNKRRMIKRRKCVEQRPTGESCSKDIKMFAK